MTRQGLSVWGCGRQWVFVDRWDFASAINLVANCTRISWVKAYLLAKNRVNGWLALILGVHQPIANSCLRQQVLRLRWVNLEFLPQVTHVNSQVVGLVR